MTFDRFSELQVQNWDTLIIVTGSGAGEAPQHRIPTKTGEPAVVVVVSGMFNACHKLGHHHLPEQGEFAVNVEAGAVLIASIMSAFETAGIDPATLRAAIDQKRAAIRDDGFLPS